eukprot:4486330-Amphidinium_carterae.3
MEVDEVSVCSYPSGDDEKPMNWVGYLGMVEWGVPSSLKLVQLTVCNTVMWAPAARPRTFDKGGLVTNGS